jgi:hypothetical protein
MNGTAAVGSGTTWARADHVHPSDTSQVIKAGDTMTGALTIKPASGDASFTLDAASGSARNFNGATNGSFRWNMQFGNSTVESGGASGTGGSDFALSRFDNSGTYLDSPITILRGTGAVIIKGTATNDNASAGCAGEVISSNITAAVTLTTATPANVTSISLTAGDWDVYGEVWISVGTGGATQIKAAINSASATFPVNPSLNTATSQISAAITASLFSVLSLRTCRVSLSATTTHYLIAQATFPSGTTQALGNIIARRAR